MAEAPELFVSASVPAFAVGAGTESGTGPAKSAIQELIISTLDIPTSPIVPSKSKLIFVWLMPSILHFLIQSGQCPNW